MPSHSATPACQAILFQRCRDSPIFWLSVIAAQAAAGRIPWRHADLVGRPAVARWPRTGHPADRRTLIAFGLTALIGLEREIHGKSAGLRTQAIVGTASALILIVSKYGFSDVLSAGLVEVDPSRVAAQIVSGIGFLGAGLIITRQGAVHGLTTAAAIWECAAIGMAAAAGWSSSRSS